MSRPVEKVTDASEVAVGRYYLVPAVRIRLSGWTPVLGPKHRDVEILNFPREHWHYDWRFLTQRQVDELFPAAMSGADPEPVHPFALAHVAFTEGGGTARGDVKWIRRRCMRAMPVFLERPPSGYALRLAALEDAYASARIKPDCRVCPHRGLPLNGLSPDEHGTVVCPGHGLAWNATTGALVRRIDKEAFRG